MQRILILGGGHIGLNAAQKLRRRCTDNEITVVDISADVADQFRGLGVHLIQDDAIAYLSNNINAESASPEWIVPAIPHHVAFEWLYKNLKGSSTLTVKPIPKAIQSMLPNFMLGNDQQVFISNADFLCPDNCDESERLCTYTRKPRPRNLNDYLAQLQFESYFSIVLYSHQLAPGLGGFTPQMLFNLRSQLNNYEGNCLLSTACRCHGVMHAFRLETKSDLKMAPSI